MHTPDNTQIYEGSHRELSEDLAEPNRRSRLGRLTLKRQAANQVQ